MPDNPSAVILLTVGQVAQDLDLSAQSVRRYAHEFRDHLGPDANPGHGATRQFSSEDIQVMRAAKRFLMSGLTYETTNQRLDLVSIDVPSDPPPTVSTAVDLQPLQSTVSIVLAHIDRMDQTLQSTLTDRLTDHQTVVQLAATVEKMREDRTRPIVYLFWFGAGFGCALLALYLFTFIR
jgi:DNA-binding transcriptional MerR regulator